LAGLFSSVNQQQYGRLPLKGVAQL